MIFAESLALVTLAEHLILVTSADISVLQISWPAYVASENY